MDIIQSNIKTKPLFKVIFCEDFFDISRNFINLRRKREFKSVKSILFRSLVKRSKFLGFY